jgi:hypothetical protein
VESHDPEAAATYGALDDVGVGQQLPPGRGAGGFGYHSL